jgi:hypothetical protein
MKRLILLGSLALTLLVSGLAPQSTEARDRRDNRDRSYHRGERTVVRVHTGFPIRRTLPQVVIRSPHINLRVSPRLYLPPVVFNARVVRTPPRRDAILWEDSESLDRRDGWTEVFLDVDHRGKALYLDISHGAAQLSFAEVVFENGETRVVDFADRQQRIGLYPLLDFRDGRKVDHVRLVAKASSGRDAEIGLRLVA